MRKSAILGCLACLLISGCSLRRPVSDCVDGSCGAVKPKNIKAGPPLLDETVVTELSIELDSRYQFGQLQVDMKALEQKTADLKKLNDELKKQYDEEQKKRLMQQAKSGTVAAAGIAADCAAPAQKGFDGGISRDAFVPKVLTPVDIPLMIPVTLRASVGGSSLANAGIRKKLLKTPCDTGPKSGPCVPACDAPGVIPAPGATGPASENTGPASESAAADRVSPRATFNSFPAATPAGHVSLTKSATK